MKCDDDVVEAGILFLDDKLLLAEGGQRLCYLHPTDSTKIIKILPQRVASDNQNELESVYLGYLLKKGVSFKHLTQCFGYVDTNLGRGLVFERALNSDGTPSMSLKYMMEEKLLSLERQQKLVLELVSYLRENQIIFADMASSNIFCRRDKAGDYSLLIVDGLGARRFNYRFWMYMWIGFYRRSKINKQEKKLMRLYC
ncbi:MAG: hypothetical protein HRU05_01835 [Oceanospirillaceae bacterium]|nr:hypothetical protein [Oceanospirillaceae bacterium]